MSNNDLIQKGQDDLIRRGDALVACQGMDPEGDINAIPAAQPTVKPLVWFEKADGGETCLTDERYSISYWEREKLFVDRYTTMRRHHTIEAAKAAAQADYEARILSVLDMQPTVSPDVAALVTLLARAKEELRMIRMKDSGAVYDVLLRIELDAALARVKGVM